MTEELTNNFLLYLYFVCQMAMGTSQKNIKKSYIPVFLWDEFLSKCAITLPAEDDAGRDGADGAAVEEEGGV